LKRGIEWAAGLFEGEGCIQCRPYVRPDRQREDTRRTLSLSSTDLDVLENFHEAVGYIGRITGPKLKPGRKPIWRWTCSSWNQAAPLLTEMLPYLGKRRRRRAKVFLSHSPAACRKVLRLSDEDVAEIRRLAKTSMKRREIASTYGISPSYLSNIVKGIVRVRPLYGKEFQYDSSS
jgi:hypothetical protein